MMIRSIRIATILGLFLCATAPVGAQMSVAYVDVGKVIAESQRGEALMQQLRNEFMKPLDDLKKEEGQLVELRVQLSKPDPSLTEETLRAVQKDLEDRQRRYQRRSEDLEKDVQDRRIELFNIFEVEVLDLVEVIRAERKIGIIFSKGSSGFLAIDPGLDLTDEVMRRIDQAG